MQSVAECFAILFDKQQGDRSAVDKKNQVKSASHGKKENSSGFIKPLLIVLALAVLLVGGGFLVKSIFSPHDQGEGLVTIENPQGSHGYEVDAGHGSGKESKGDERYE